MIDVQVQVNLSSEKKLLFGYALALVAAGLYGASSVVAKKAMGTYDIPPVIFTAFSLMFGTIMLLAVAQHDIGSSLVIPKRYFVFIMAAGVSSGSAVTFLALALNRAPVAVVTPVLSLSPLVTLVLVHLFLRRLERVSSRVILGTVVALAGVILVIMGGSQL